MKPDYCTKEGAELLAQRIREYWASRGLTVEVGLQQMPFNMRMRERWFAIQSNMVNALPPRKKFLPHIDKR